MAHFSYSATIAKTYKEELEINNSRELPIRFTHYSFDYFFDYFSKLERFTHGPNTIYAIGKDYPEIYEGYQKEIVERQKYIFYIDYHDGLTVEDEICEVRYMLEYQSIVFEMFGARERHSELLLFYTISKDLGLNLMTSKELVTPKYLENLRIKEENKNTKLTANQIDIFDQLENELRCIFIDSPDVEETLNYFGVTETSSQTMESTNQGDGEGGAIGIMKLKGHQLVIGNNIPYLFYPSMVEYKAIENHEIHLIDSLKQMSKEFKDVQYYEYNKHGVASLVRCKKGKLVYAKFSYEGEFREHFGTQKTTIDFNKRPLKKVAKRWGIDIDQFIIDFMKQNLEVNIFDQPDYAMQVFKSMF